MENKPFTRFMEILFPKANPFNNYSVNGENVLGPLSLINIFIGPNNSGKSRFMRGLFSLEDYIFNTNKFDLKTMDQEIKTLAEEYKQTFGNEIVEVGNNNIGFFDLPDSEIHFLNPKNPINKLIIEKLDGLAMLPDVPMNMKGRPGGGITVDSEKIVGELRSLAKNKLYFFEPLRIYDLMINLELIKDIICQL